MRMFLSVSGHSSELSIANHTLRPTVSQLKCVFRHHIKLILRITNHRRKKSPPSFTLLSFKTNQIESNQMSSRLTTTTSFPRVFFHFLQFSRPCPSFSAHRAAPMTKTDLIFPAFSSRFVDFAVQFSAFFVSFHSREATLESGLTVA